MEDIAIEKTTKTPYINFKFQQNHLEIKGVSIPEDADSFYTPLMEWVDRYVEKKKNQKTTVVLKLIYFNTSTSDYLVTMLKNLKKIKTSEEETLSQDSLGEINPDLSTDLHSDLETEKSEPDTLPTNGNSDDREAEHLEDETPASQDASSEEHSDTSSQHQDSYQNGQVHEEEAKELAERAEIQQNHPLRIEWHYEEEDEDMRETGSHFESIIDLPFFFQACEEIN